MDRRQKKTRAAIYRAFSTVLERKRYEHITVQDIIDEADIGRSTFYAHFETKDDLLRSLCTDLFTHVFSSILPEEHSGADPMEALELKLGHVLFHLKENNQNLRGLLCRQSGALFMEQFRVYLADLFREYLDCFPLPVPREYLLHHLVGSFSETVSWWVAREMEPDPDTVAKMYITVVTCKKTSQ